MQPAYGIWGEDLPTLNYLKSTWKTNNFKFTGKESLQGTGFIDFGARWYDNIVPRFTTQDKLSEKYFSNAPYVYVHNNPTNAIDPDGRLVIFINGQGPTRPLKEYWGGFDSEVMKQLNDENSHYYDGSIGGWFNTVINGLSPIDITSNLEFSNRYNVGEGVGYYQAEELIKNLARDKDGNITESIKIITHSMGGAYGSGFAEGLKKYISKHPELAKQVRVSLVAHFDPFQGDNIEADPSVYTMQFLHRNGLTKNGKQRKSSDGLGRLANNIVGGVDFLSEDDNDSSHSINTFFNEIGSLREGNYTWNGNTWVCQNCK